MATDTIQLDDLNWDELTTDSRERIAGASDGQWTHHAPVDPGITLLELYASQLEQRLFWMDQPSEELQRALMRLLQTETRGAECANTVLQLWSRHECSDADFVCPTLVAPARYSTFVRDQELQFQSNDAIHLFPIRVDRTNGQSRRKQVITPAVVYIEDERFELNSLGRESLRLWDPSREEPTCQVEFQLSSPLQLDEDETAFSLLLELDTPDSVSANWVPKRLSPSKSEFKTQPKPTSRIHFGLALSAHAYSDHSDAPIHDLRLSEVVDGTDGLQRSGLVQFKLRPQGQFDESRFLRIRITADAANFAFVPRLKQAIPNAVTVVHRVKHMLCDNKLDAVARTWKKKFPHSHIDLAPENGSRMLGRLLTAPADAKVQILENDSDVPITWSPVSSFTSQTSADRVFVACRKDSRLLFGDGIRGRIPVPQTAAQGSEAIPEISYHWGGGEEGNVNVGLQWGPRFIDGQNRPPRLQATNVVPGVGGQEEEELDATIRRCRSELKRPTRTVTKSDIESLSLQTPNAGIARAHAVVGYHPNYSLVSTPGAITVFVVPELPSSLQKVAIEGDGTEELTELIATADQLRAVSDYLNDRRLITQEIFVLPARYQRVELEIHLSSVSSFGGDIPSFVRQSLNEYLHPLYGGVEENGWAFGESLRPSEFVGYLRSKLDCEARVTTVGVRLGDGGEREFESCNATHLTPHTLVSLRQVRVRTVSSSSTSGGLR